MISSFFSFNTSIIVEKPSEKCEILRFHTIRNFSKLILPFDKAEVQDGYRHTSFSAPISDSQEFEVSFRSHMSKMYQIWYSPIPPNRKHLVHSHTELWKMLSVVWVHDDFKFPLRLALESSMHRVKWINWLACQEIT